MLYIDIAAMTTQSMQLPIRIGMANQVLFGLVSGSSQHQFNEKVKYSNITISHDYKRFKPKKPLFQFIALVHNQDYEGKAIQVQGVH